MNFLTTNILVYLLIFLGNFLLAFMLKAVNKQVCKQYPSLKFIYIIPPVSIILWVLVLIILLINGLNKILKEYFID